MKKFRKILLVDDSLTQASKTKAVLEDNGYKVYLAKNGIDALDFLKKNSLPELILTDVVMPKMDGFELCLNALDLYPDIPVIIFTEFDNENKLQKAFECGAIEYIPKPFSNLELLVRVKNVLNLKNNERTYKNLFNKMLNGSALFEVIFDKNNEPEDFIFLEVNKAFEKLTNLSKKEVTLQKVSKILSNDDKNSVNWIQVFKNVINSGNDARFEGYSKTFNKWFSVTAYIPEQGYIATIIKDITERKNNEQKLIGSEKRLIGQHKTLIEILKNKILFSESLNESFKFITKKASKALNVERVSIWLLSRNSDEMICKCLYSSSSNDHSSGIKLKSLDYPNYFKSIYKENIIAADDAHTDPRTNEFTKNYFKTFDITSMLDVGIRIGGEVIGVICFEHVGNKRNWLTDELLFTNSIASIIAHIITTSNLSKSEQRFKDICNSMADWVWEIDKNGVYTYCSENIKKVLGYSAEEIIGKTPFDLISPENNREVKTFFEEISRKAEPFFDLENWNITKDGKRICLLSSGFPFFDNNGKLIGYRGVDKDITLRKKYEREINRSREEIESAHKHAIYMLALASEYKDPETGDHINRIIELTKELALELGFNKQNAEKLGFDCILHDLGKIGISDYILLKPGRLTSEEYEAMKQHTIIGAEIIGNDKWFKQSMEIALAHHEHWNGKGYPKGLKGSKIPLSARIVAIADVFDALISKRPYKDAWTLEDTIKEIQKDSGKHFDPKIVEAFMSLQKKGKLKKYIDPKNWKQN